jgi:predicted DNA-binding transcriptional regulator AlpA
VEPELWSIAEVCRMLRTSPRNLRRLIAKGIFPRPLAVGQCRLWPALIVREWIERPYVNAEGASNE